MKLAPRDTEAIRKVFEDVLRRTQKVGRTEKMKLRSSIRRELSFSLVLVNPTPEGLLSRWEDKLADVFMIMSHRFKDDLMQTLKRQLLEKKQKMKKSAP